MAAKILAEVETIFCCFRFRPSSNCKKRDEIEEPISKEKDEMIM